MWKKLLSLVLVVALSVVVIPTSNTKAAFDSVKYIKDVRLFIKEKGTFEDAKNWCTAQNKNQEVMYSDDKWRVLEGNLNSGADGAFKQPVGVFLCYTRTEDPTEAITDMAVMNEVGNYSSPAYEKLLEEQKNEYKDLVDDTWSMIEEYRTNYKRGLETAKQAHDFLNGYIEDDSEKLLGDLLLTVEADDLVSILLQANGNTVLMIQEQLAYATDIGSSTWLDRMEQLGSFTTLRNKALKAYNNNASKADAALKKKYNAQAAQLLESWSELNQRIDHYKKMIKAYGLHKMSEQEIQKWFDEVSKNENPNEDLELFLNEYTILEALSVYKYDGKTLLEYFNQGKSQFSGDNIKYLYPLVASLSNGQKSALDQSLSMYQLLQNAICATAFNDYKSGKATMIDKARDGSREETEKVKNQIANGLKEWKEEEPISIYEGVDRDIYKGGVAVTSTAENFSNGSGTNWTDSFVDNGGLAVSAVGMLAGSVIFGFAARAMAKKLTELPWKVIDKAINNVRLQGITSVKAQALSQYECSTRFFLVNKNYTIDHLKNPAALGLNPAEVKRFKSIRNDLYAKNYDALGARSASILKGLKIGFTVLCILLAVADIVLSSIALYQYYNRDHLPIPNYMVDITYNSDKETSFINYKSVKDNKDKNGDLNGGGGKQWLALYATHDPDAGKPILAPSNYGAENLYVITGSNKGDTGSYPLHLFGTPNASQNLTFADGESGWSYNDKNNGTYLFFRRDENYVPMDEEGTVMSSGRIVLIGSIGLIAGCIAGAAATIFLTGAKKKKEDEE